MTGFLGIDIGTSAVKALLVDERQAVVGAATVPLSTRHPGPLASEQAAEAWWDAVAAALDRLAADQPRAMAGVAAIGLAGQMHAALLLDEADRPVRPAMLWNDGRAHAEARRLRAEHPALQGPLGVPAMAGLTAPKLLWLARHEPASLARARCLLLAKDYIRLRLTGERATDASDAAGTWLLDQRRRAWSPEAVAAAGIDPGLLPPVVEGTARTGSVRPELARRFGLPDGVAVAGGAGDTPAGGIGIGAVREGAAYVALGTSAQLFVATEAFRPAPERALHAFCHGLEGRWYQMAAMLNGASVLGFFARLLGQDDLPALLAAVEAEFAGPSPLLVLPYLAGERTPHDNPHARGVVFGLSPSTTGIEVAQAALEGVAFSFADALAAMTAAGTRIAEAGFIGGGARSRLWARIVASVLDIPLSLHEGGERGPAFGAARLARLCLGRDDPAAVLAAPPVTAVVAPEPGLVERYRPRIEAFRRLYRAVEAEFAEARPPAAPVTA
ncbi:MAG TPA: xylulokinase [Alphaproteobacteria bacterium]|nr:xylulokinase [Alphaproteobacteria bacterium]